MDRLGREKNDQSGCLDWWKHFLLFLFVEDKSVCGIDAPTKITYMDTQVFGLSSVVVNFQLKFVCMQDVARLTLTALRNEKAERQAMTLAGPRAWTTQEVLVFLRTLYCI